MAVQLIYHPSLYLSDGLTTKELEKIKNRLGKKPYLSKEILLTPASNPADLLEFYEARLLSQSYYRDKTVYVVGICKTYDDALKLVEKIVSDCYMTRGDCSIREFLSC